MDLTAGEARSRFATARVAHLATPGAPHIVPICFALGVNGAAATRGAHDVLYTGIDTQPTTSAALPRLAHIRSDDPVSVLVDFYAEDWSKLWWVRLDGRARLLETHAGGDGADGPDGRHFDTELELATALLTARYPQYLRAPFGGPVIAIDVDRWSGWTAADTASMSAGQSHAVRRVEPQAPTRAQDATVETPEPAPAADATPDKTKVLQPWPARSRAVAGAVRWAARPPSA